MSDLTMTIRFFSLKTIKLIVAIVPFASLHYSSDLYITEQKLYSAELVKCVCALSWRQTKDVWWACLSFEVKRGCCMEMDQQSSAERPCGLFNQHKMHFTESLWDWSNEKLQYFREIVKSTEAPVFWDSGISVTSTALLTLIIRLHYCICNQTSMTLGTTTMSSLCHSMNTLLQD